MSSEQTELAFICDRCGGRKPPGVYILNGKFFCSEHGCVVRSGFLNREGNAVEQLRIATSVEPNAKADELPVLVEAQKLIHGDREREYAPPSKSFLAIADYWTTYLESRGLMPSVGPGLTAIDVANMMILLKVARTMSGEYKRDTYVDIAGYAGCAERVHKES